MAVTSENNAKIREIMLGDGKTELSELVNINGISKVHLGHIIQNFLRMKQIFFFHQDNTPAYRVCDTTDNDTLEANVLWISPLPNVVTRFGP